MKIQHVSLYGETEVTLMIEIQVNPNKIIVTNNKGDVHTARWYGDGWMFHVCGDRRLLQEAYAAWRKSA